MLAEFADDANRDKFTKLVRSLWDFHNTLLEKEPDLTDLEMAVR